MYIDDLHKHLPVPFRLRDHCLMDVMLDLPNIRKKEIRAFNRVRLYLGVTFLSEISTANGTQVDRAAWNGSRTRKSAQLWPHQPQPGPQSFRAWRRLLATAFLQGHRTRVGPQTRDLRLRTSLGSWRSTAQGVMAQWPFQFSPSTRCLYTTEPGIGLIKHTPKRIRYRPRHPIRSFHKLPTHCLDPRPPDVVPVDVSTEPNRLVIPFEVGTALPDIHPRPAPTTWDEYQTRLPQWEKLLLQHTTFLDSQQTIELLSTASHLHFASDGGAIPTKAAFGCVLASDDTILVECGGQVEGQDPRSFRAESYGLLAILRIIHHIRIFFDTGNPALKFSSYTDSESLLLRLETSMRLSVPSPRRTLLSKADVEMEIMAALHSFPTIPVLHHVEGHQDSKYPMRPLSWEAQLNQRCDAIATDYLNQSSQVLYTTSFFPASKVSLQVSQTTLTHHIPSQLRMAMGYQAQRAYLCQHHDWEPEAFDLIDWHHWHTAVRHIPFLQRLFVVKWINDLLPFQKQQYKFRQSPSASCPSSCGCHSEDWAHFLRCTHPHRIDAWREFVQTLNQTLDQHNWDPTLRRILTKLILTVIEPNAPNIPTHNMSPEYTMLMTTQLQLGTDSIFFGFFVKEWYLLQHRYLQVRHLPHNHNQADNAIKAVISALLLQTQSIWILRNSHLHGTDPLRQHSYARLHLLAQIQELYNCRPLMLAADQDILSTPYTRRLEQPTTTLRTFYNWAKPLVERSVQEAAELGPSFRRIDSYFCPNIPPALLDAISIPT